MYLIFITEDDRNPACGNSFGVDGAVGKPIKVGEIYQLGSGRPEVKVRSAYGSVWVSEGTPYSYQALIIRCTLDSSGNVINVENAIQTLSPEMQRECARYARRV